MAQDIIDFVIIITVSDHILNELVKVAHHHKYYDYYDYHDDDKG